MKYFYLRFLYVVALPVLCSFYVVAQEEERDYSIYIFGGGSYFGEVSRPIKPNAVIADIDDQTKQQVLGYRVAPQRNRYVGTLGVFLIGRAIKITFQSTFSYGKLTGEQ